MVRSPSESEHRGGVAKREARHDRASRGRAEPPFDRDERDDCRHRHESGEEKHARRADREQAAGAELRRIHFSSYSATMHRAVLLLPLSGLLLSSALLALGLLLRLAR